jgi:general secretion pathway protein G
MWRKPFDLKMFFTHRRGFTAIELLVAIGIFGILVGIAVPAYIEYLERARVGKAVGDIRLIDSDIQLYRFSNEKLPATLAVIGKDKLLDPYGNPYVYATYASIPPGQRRKDRFLVPLNSDYDLYSSGRDGKSVAPLTAKASQDDIVRANDGSYVGLGSDY